MKLIGALLKHDKEELCIFDKNENLIAMGKGRVLFDVLGGILCDCLVIGKTRYIDTREIDIVIDLKIGGKNNG